MGIVRKMSLEDVDRALIVFTASFENAWNRHEKDYYPRSARANLTFNDTTLRTLARTA